MTEYIERAAVEKFIEDGLNNPDKNKAFGHDAIEIMAEIHYMPAADVVEVRHGRWIGSEMNFGYCDIIQKEYIAKKYICSECGYETGDQAKKFVCCPICMARMDKEDEHEAG